MLMLAKSVYIRKEENRTMKKRKIAHPGELHKLPDTEEWEEVEFTEPFEVRSVFKKKVKV